MDDKALENEIEFQRLQSLFFKIIAELVEFRDIDTGGHIERTQNYLGSLLGALIRNNIYRQEIDTWDLKLVISSSQLHDIGKIAVRDCILQKPGKLTDQEFEEMKEHTVQGVKIIEKIMGNLVRKSFLETAKILAGTHHEKWDGSGYPEGLKGEEIPLLGRLMAIADVYDALVSERPYKKPFTHKKAVEITKEGRGTHFDPVLVDIFLETADEFNEIATARNNNKS